MCLVGEILIESIMAWSLAKNDWTEITLCMEQKESRGYARDPNGKEVDIFQAVIGDKAYWFIDDKEKK